MKKTTLFATACAVIFAAPMVSADVYGGFMLPPGIGPIWWVNATPSELLAPCDPAGPTTGIDGYWFDISHESPGAPYFLDVADTLDADSMYYDSGCNFIVAHGPGIVGEDESGLVPAGTAWLFVVHFAGAGDFTYEIF